MFWQNIFERNTTFLAHFTFRTWYNEKRPSTTKPRKKAAKAAQTMRKATDEERKNLRVRLGEPQTTAPEGVDMSQVIKMKV